MEFIAGLLIGAVFCFFLVKNDQAQDLGKPNGKKKDFGKESADARHNIFIEAQGIFQKSKRSDPVVFSYFLSGKSILLTRVVRLVDKTGTTILFDQIECPMTFDEFQSLLKSFSRFPGFSLEEAVNKKNVLKASCSFIVYNEYISIECYFFGK